jgi:hypothetical protein
MNPLLEVARCPITHEPFCELTVAELKWINSRISAQQLRNRADEVVEMEWKQGLINESRTWIYPIFGHGAALIPDEAIAGSALPASDEPHATNESD